MQCLFRLFLILSLPFTFLCAKGGGAWIEHDLGMEYSSDYRQAVGGNCLIYYHGADDDTVWAFDTYSHLWHGHPARFTSFSAKAYAGENAAMIWNDSLLVLYDALHSTFHTLEYDGELVYKNIEPYNIPASVGSMSYILTSEKLYVFDQDKEQWAEYAYSHPGTGSWFGYSGHPKKDYILISINNQTTYETKLLAYSKSRAAFDEISTTNLQWQVMDQGFASWVNGGVDESDFFFTAYSADNGFFESIYPNKYFDVHFIYNARFAESTVFLTSYYIPSVTDPGGMRYIYAADTRHSSWATLSFADAYGSTGSTLDQINAGYQSAVITTRDVPSRAINTGFYDGQSNTFSAFDNSGLYYDNGSYGYYAGTSYFTGYDKSNFIFDNRKSGDRQTVQLPPPSDGYNNPTNFSMHADWAVAKCKRALNDSVFIYSMHTRSNAIQTLIEPYYTYDYGELKSKYYYYLSQAYNDAHKILVYAPDLDSWTELPLASDASWFMGEDFITTYDKHDGNMKIHDVPVNADLSFPLGWDNSYQIDLHTYGRDRFYIAYNTDGHYFTYSSYTRDIKEEVYEVYSNLTSRPVRCMVAMGVNNRDILAYNAKSNALIGLQLDDTTGDYRLSFLGDSTLLVVTAHGHLFAFDPYAEAVGIEDPGTDGKDLPIQFRLAQNYPNPFNPTTEISYQLAEPAKIRLQVFNSLGQKVRILADGRKKAGNHSLSFDAGNLASGVYYLRLSTDTGLVQTRKMILLR